MAPNMEQYTAGSSRARLLMLPQIPVSETVGGNKEAGSDLTRRGDTETLGEGENEASNYWLM